MNSSLDIFPYVLVRTSGGPTEDLAPLRLEKTVILLQAIEANDLALNQLSTALNEIIYSHIARLNGNPAQKKLLNLKRAVFNQKKIRNSDFEACQQVLPADLLLKLTQYRNHITEKERLDTLAQEAYHEEILPRVEQLKTLFQQENLKKGLVLSSQSLLDRIQGYLKRPRNKMRKKEAQTEQAMLKYITRMYCKTSPFSTFTSLSTANLQAHPAHLLQGTEAQPKQKGHIRVNNQLFAYLRTLLTQSKKTNQFFPIRVNPSLKVENESHYLFLVNDKNNEAFQRIPLNPVLDLFIEILAEHPGGMPLDELVQFLIEEDIIDTDREQLENYLTQLLEVGFLAFEIGVSGIDTEWDLTLIKKLQPLAQKHVLFPELIAILQELRKSASLFAEATADQRIELLKQAHAQIRGICMKLHEDAGFPAEERKTQAEIMEEYRNKVAEEKQKAKEAKEKEAEVEEKKEEKEAEKNPDSEVFKKKSNTFFYFKPEQIFYEDASLSGTYSLDQQAVSTLIEKLDTTLQSLWVYENYFNEQARMKQFFQRHYPAQTRVDLLNFYEDYFRHIRKPIAEHEKQIEKERAELLKKQKELRDNQAEKEEIAQVEKELQELTKRKPPAEFLVDDIEARNKVLNEWTQVVRKTFQTEEQQHYVSADSAQIANIAQTTTPDYLPESVNSSFGTFMQVFEEEGPSGEKKVKAVCNASFQGYGKFASRFLHILDPGFKETLVEWNQKMVPDGAIYAEDTDASTFNANLHPSILPAEICIPNGNNILPPEQQILVNDIEVSLAENGLGLFHKQTGERIYVFDLGFQGHAGRSELFQLLEKFTEAKLLYGYSLTHNIGLQQEKEKPAKPAPAPQITQLPRVSIDDQLIFRRRTWQVPVSLLPSRNPREEDAAYFVRLNRWRQKLEIPDEVFVFVYASHQRNKLGKQVKKVRAGRDDYKPQYIHFHNPFLVNYFDKLLRKVPISLRIEEMLPNSSQLLQFGDKKYVSEFMIQWYKQGTP